MIKLIEQVTSQYIWKDWKSNGVLRATFGMTNSLAVDPESFNHLLPSIDEFYLSMAFLIYRYQFALPNLLLIQALET